MAGGASGNTARRKPGFFSLLFIIAIIAGVNGALSLYVGPAVSGWYAGLEKPPLTPPGPAFGVVWFGLYIMIGLSLWGYLRAGATLAGGFLWAAQMAMNAAWTVLFFGLENTLNGFFGALCFSC